MFHYKNDGSPAKWWYTLSNFPGNHEVIVSHNVYIIPEYRNQGLGQHLHKERLTNAKNIGGCYILATVDSDNKAQVHIMEKMGWKKLDSFISDCTCNEVVIYGRRL